jgi:hypothetical protein
MQSLKTKGLVSNHFQTKNCLHFDCHFRSLCRELLVQTKLSNFILSNTWMDTIISSHLDCQMETDSVRGNCRDCRTMISFNVVPWLNFTNVLCAAFTYESFAHSFLCLCCRFVLYWCKTVGAKAGRRMLIKLSPGAIQFHQQKYTQPYWYAWPENTLNSSYALCCAPVRLA